MTDQQKAVVLQRTVYYRLLQQSKMATSTEMQV